MKFYGAKRIFSGLSHKLFKETPEMGQVGGEVGCRFVKFSVFGPIGNKKEGTTSSLFLSALGRF